MKIDGYVIAPPVSPWDDPAKVIPYMSHSTFGITPLESWMKHIRHKDYDRDTTKPLIQRWFDRGYRLRKATLIIGGESNENNQD